MKLKYRLLFFQNDVVHKSCVQRHVVIILSIEPISCFQFHLITEISGEVTINRFDISCLRFKPGILNRK